MSQEAPGETGFPMFTEYNPGLIEARWQGVWQAERSWQVSNGEGGRNRAYVLEQLPYTSGEPHVGHLKNYTVGDAVAHYWRRQGRYVLHPMGFDAFGLPGENHAIRAGEHPRVSTGKSIAAFREQFRRWGLAVDWDREVSSHDPAYYRWTQWIFLQLHAAGLAYRKEAAVNWCPRDETVLANEQVISGQCERCGTPVRTRQMKQWFFRITSYAGRLLAGLDSLDWPEHVKTMQRNWIGRSEGAFIDFAAGDNVVRVFTTRPGSLPGATYLVLAPEHGLVDTLTAAAWPGGTDPRWTGGHATPREAVAAYRDRTAGKSELERRAGADVRTAAGCRPGQANAAGCRPGQVSAVFTGSFAVNPASGRPAAIFIADYVLASDGTGAIMGVPGQDERDREFAEAFGLPVIRPVQPPPDWTGPAWLAERGFGEPAVSYRLRDWLLSRQRYWGCPIPVIYCGTCGAVPVPEDQLPVVLPDLDDYQPRGRSPLAAAAGWLAVPCPRCGGPGRRESDTMDTFVDSSWYFLRYCDPHNSSAPWSAEAAAAWMPADCYVGGVEHAVLHLLYSRFLVRALADLGHLPVREPFTRFFAQGMITRDGAKISKSRGNSISPREIIDRYGADAARCYVLFTGPPQQSAEWSGHGIEGVHRFLRRVWRLTAEVLAAKDQGQGQDRDLALQRACGQAVRQVTGDIEDGFAFNTAIAALMKLASDCARAVRDGASAAAAAQAVATLASLLQPFAPHLASEVYYQITGERVWTVPWPATGESVPAAGTAEIAWQVNGKVRGRLSVPAGASEAEVQRAALAAAQVRDLLAGRTPARVVVVPGRLVNIVL